MADINFSGNKQLKSINKEFCAQFPYIFLSFSNEKGTTVWPWDKTHASIRAGGKTGGELKASPNMKVGNFEKRYEDTFGVKIEVKYNKNGRSYKTNATHDEMTLNQMNIWAEDNGCAEIIPSNPDWFK